VSYIRVISRLSVTALTTYLRSLQAAAHVMIRDAYEDTTLQIPNPVGEEGTKSVAIEKDTVVIVDMVGIRECLS